MTANLWSFSFSLPVSYLFLGFPESPVIQLKISHRYSNQPAKNTSPWSLVYRWVQPIKFIHPPGINGWDSEDQEVVAYEPACMSMCHVHTCGLRGQKRTSDSMEMELLMAVSCLMSVETKSRSHGKAASALHGWAGSLVPLFNFLLAKQLPLSLSYVWLFPCIPKDPSQTPTT